MSNMGLSESLNTPYLAILYWLFKRGKNSPLSLSLRFFFLSSSFSFGQEHVKELKLFVVLLMEALLRNGTALSLNSVLLRFNSRFVILCFWDLIPVRNVEL